MGWTVIRFWGKDIRKNVDKCVNVIEETIFETNWKEMKKLILMITLIYKFGCRYEEVLFDEI